MTQATYRQSNTEFGLNLFRSAFAASAGASDPLKQFAVQVSPFSTRRGITMAGIGALDKTRSAILEALCLPKGVDFRQVNEDNHAFVQRLLAAEARATKTPTTLNIANALWLRKDDDPDGYHFLPDFIAENKRYYDAAVRTIPFDDNALGLINGWCDKNTNGKIDKILEELPAAARAFLTDALYIKTPAANRFYRRQDQKIKFTHLDGKTQTEFDFMTQFGSLRYFAGDGLEVLEFPFGRFGAFNFYLLLPAADSSLQSLVKKLTVANWDLWRGNLAKGSGTFRIAPNEQEWGDDLVPYLSELGMGIAFDDDKSNFLGMCTKRLKIGGVKHKTYTKFTHKGFEGAAVTAVGMFETTSFNPIPVTPYDVTVDRPYAWLVTGFDEILFAGSTTLPVIPKDIDKGDDDDDNDF
jgi:serine protease inhibitor